MLGSRSKRANSSEPVRRAFLYQRRHSQTDLNDRYTDANLLNDFSLLLILREDTADAHMLCPPRTRRSPTEDVSLIAEACQEIR